jgi:hypothetical protein
VTAGVGGGLYGVNQNTTRGQMATFICKAAGKSWYAAPTQKFSDVARGTNGVWDGGGTPTYDVDGTHAFYGWIERLADAASWGPYGPPTAGFGDGTFRPNNSCSRGEMAVFIQRAAEFELPVK